MSAALPVVAQQLEPGAECAPCANQNFPEHKHSPKKETARYAKVRAIRLTSNPASPGTWTVPDPQSL